MRDVLSAAELHAVATIAAATLPVRVLAPGVSGEMLARCGGDPERANTLLALRRERADHDRLEPRAFTVGSVWMDRLSQSGGHRQVRVIGAHGTFVRFSGMRGGRTFTLPRERARARMRFVESGK